MLDHFSKNLLEFDMDTCRDLLVLVFLNNAISLFHQFLQCYTTLYILFDISLILAMKITVLFMNIKIKWLLDDIDWVAVKLQWKWFSVTVCFHCSSTCMHVKYIIYCMWHQPGLENIKINSIPNKIKWKMHAFFALYFKFWRYFL